MIAAYFVLAPEDLARLGRSSIYASLSASNFFFWLEAGYFDQFANTKPLLHTWSLGVEEQFYLLWPLLIFCLYRWKGRRGAIIGLILFGAMSLLGAAYFASRNPSSVFYLMPFRIYQFALGGLLALSTTLRPGLVRSAAAYAAIAILIAITILSSGETGSYWVNAAAPALAAAMFIWSAEAGAVKRVFASSPMIWIGRRSYAIYLVHWPIMVLWPMATDFDLSPVEGWISIGASIVLGAIVHDTVERPLRFKHAMTARRKTTSLVASGALLVVCVTSGAHLWGLNGFPSRIPQEIRTAAGDIDAIKVARAKLLNEYPCEQWKDEPISAFSRAKCATPAGGKRSYFLIGDSFGTGTAAALRMAYPDIHLGQLTVPACVTSIGERIRDSRRPWCRKFMDLAFEIAQEEQGFDSIVFAASWRHDRIQAQVINELIKWANDQGRVPIIFGYRLRFKERAPVIVLSSRNMRLAEKRAQAFIEESAREDAATLLEQLQGEFKYVDIMKIQCPDNVCPIFNDDGKLLYFDQHHFTADGMKWIAEKLQRDYPELFSASKTNNENVAPVN